MIKNIKKDIGILKEIEQYKFKAGRENVREFKETCVILLTLLESFSGRYVFSNNGIIYSIANTAGGKICYGKSNIYASRTGCKNNDYHSYRCRNFDLVPVLL